MCGCNTQEEREARRRAQLDMDEHIRQFQASEEERLRRERATQEGLRDFYSNQIEELHVSVAGGKEGRWRRGGGGKEEGRKRRRKLSPTGGKRSRDGSREQPGAVAQQGQAGL